MLWQQYDNTNGKPCYKFHEASHDETYDDNHDKTHDQVMTNLMIKRYDKNKHAIKDRMSWKSFFSKSTDEEREKIWN